MVFSYSEEAHRAEAGGRTPPSAQNEREDQRLLSAQWRANRCAIASESTFFSLALLGCWRILA